jgi:hypothetical protein
MGLENAHVGPVSGTAADSEAPSAGDGRARSQTTPTNRVAQDVIATEAFTALSILMCAVCWDQKVCAGTR